MDFGGDFKVTEVVVMARVAFGSLGNPSGENIAYTGNWVAAGIGC